MKKTEHLLVCLAEECSEITKESAKALRFGLQDRNPEEPESPTNEERLVDELNDLIAVADELAEIGAIPMEWRALNKQSWKRRRLSRYMDYAERKGTLDSE